MPNRNIIMELDTELSELNEKRSKLNTFLRKPNAVDIVGPIQLDLLIQQHEAMLSYSNILRTRMIHLEAK